MASAIETRGSTTPGSQPSGRHAGDRAEIAQRALGTRPEPGTRIGQYEIIRELGRGGMGAVYLARDLKLGRRVAIKLLHANQPEISARFILEARATARCNHENIVVIHEVGEHMGSPFMVLEYLEGSSLGAILRTGQPIPAARAVEWMVPVVRALVCAHEHNIVHRDLKPDNIFLSSAGTIKVLDFGVAKLLQRDYPGAGDPDNPAPSSPSLLQELARAPSSEKEKHSGNEWFRAATTEQGILVGTVPYMSPEQWGIDTVDHRTDIWAVGVILFLLITGKHPLAPRQGRELMITALVEEPMPSIRTACPGLPADLGNIIDRCLIKPKELRIGSAKRLLEALEPLLPGKRQHALPAGLSPYAGLSAFQESDADRFFGRAREIAAVLARLRDQPVIGVVGPSGAGKSSFVRAGVIPALKRSGEAWTSLVVRPGRQPLAALAHVVTGLAGDATSITAVASLSQHQAAMERLAREPGALGTILRSHARRHGHRVILFVDQLEELYTLCVDAGERRAFTSCLASVADDAASPLRVIVSIRSDYLDRVAEDDYFTAELSRGLFFSSPPGRVGLRDALIEPAEMAGYRFESAEIVDHMLDHLEHTPGALPLLQFAASKMWEMRDEDRRLLTVASYHAMGGVAGALASHADAVLASFPPGEQYLVRAIFLRLITPERTRAIVPIEELDDLAAAPGEVRRLLDQLVAARLLVVQTSGPDTVASVEIVHESLLAGWPHLQRWLDETQDDAGYLAELREAARKWHTRGKPHGLLWRGEALDEAQRFVRRYGGQLSGQQQAYLQAVFALAARSDRRKRVAIAGTIGFLTLLVAAAAVALVVIRDAQTQAADRAERIAEQLVKIRAEKDARRQAEEKTLDALEASRQANQRADEANKALREKYIELALAHDATVVANKRERRARRKARKKAEQALEALESAKKAEHDASQAKEEAEQALLLLRKTIGESQSSDDLDLIPDIPIEAKPRGALPAQSGGEPR